MIAEAGGSNKQDLKELRKKTTKINGLRFFDVLPIGGYM